MEFYDVIDKRRTIRDFDDKQVGEEVVKRILTAGMKAPSNDHLRNWEFVVINNREEISNILKKIPQKVSEKRTEFIVDRSGFKDECQRKMYLDAIPKQYSMLAKSGCLILPFFKQKKSLLEIKSINGLNGFASIWCVIENILLAATAEGLSSAIRIPFSEENIYLEEYLHHPHDYVMPCYVSIGYQSKDAIINEQKDINIDDRIHLNKW
ncbi:MAG: nitroreductase family protein [Bacilli bacterium]|nr:nitroreductase family protein [Bacilli bacterium]